MLTFPSAAKTFRRSRSALLAAVLTLAAASAAQAAAPAVLAELPADAKAVIVVNNIKDLGAKISNAAVRLNLPAPPDLPGYLARSIGITKGFDPNSSAALVLLNAPANPDAAPGSRPMVLLLPASDPKAMLAGFEPAAADKDGISEVTLPGDRGEKGYTATVDKWVAFATDRSTLETYLARKGSLAKNLPDESRKIFEDNDVVLWADIPALTQGLDKVIEDKQQDITGMMDLMNLRNEQDPFASALQKAAINEYFLAFKEYIKDATNSMVPIRLSDAGLTMGLVSQFRPDSPMGKFVAAQKDAAPASLVGLPAGDFLAAGSMHWDAPSASKVVAGIIQRLNADEVFSKDPKAQDFQKFMAEYSQNFSLISGGDFVLIQPPAGDAAKKSLFSGAYLVDSSDPQKVMDIELRAFKNPAYPQLMGADIHQEITTTPDAVTLKNVKLTKIHITYSLRPETPDKPVSAIAKQQIAVIQKMYGPDGMTMYMAPVNKHILIIFGSDAGIMEASVDAALSNSDALEKNPAIVAAKPEVVPNANCVAYISMSRILTLIEAALKPGLQPAPIADSAPVVMSEGAAGSTLTLQLHVPITTITTVKDAAGQFQQFLQSAPLNPQP